MNQRKIGVIFSYLSIGANTLVSLVYVPMLLYFLTQAEYGLYQMIGSIIAYLGLMDFGLANTTTRYFAQAKEQNDPKKQQSVISTSLKLYLTISFILVLLGVAGYFLLTPVYHKTLSAQELITAKQIYLILLVNIALFVPSNIFVAIINAHERFFFAKGVNLLKIILQPILVFAVLSWKADVLYLVIVQTLFTAFVISLNYLYCKFKLNIKFSFKESEKSLMKELTGFSVFVFLHSIMDQIYWRSGQVILGAVSGTAEVAIYAVAMQISLFAVFMPASISGVFLPKFSILAKQENGLVEINQIFCKLGRLQLIVISLIIYGFFLLGRSFLNLWVGPGYEAAYLIALIIMFGYIWDVIQNPGIPILQAMNKHSFRAYVYMVMSVLNLVLSIVLAKRYGGLGCAASTACCLLLGPGLAMNWYYRRVGLDITAFFKAIGRMFPAILIAWAAGILFMTLWPMQDTWISLILHGFIITAIYGVVLWLLAFNTYEKNLILQPLSKLYNKLNNR